MNVADPCTLDYPLNPPFEPNAALKRGNLAMDYVRLGTTGLSVSRLCLGCMNFGAGQDWMISEEESLPILRRAIEAGINFFDTANVYSVGGSEEILGRGLKTFGVRRQDAVIATKVFFPMSRGVNDRGLSRKNIMESIDASLKRLGTDYVDLYQIHRFDNATPVPETIEALNDVVKAGKALYIGASSMFAWQFAKYLYLADATGRARFITMQNHYNLLYREEEREMNRLCEAEGVGLIPWSPLAGGTLVGTRATGSVRSKAAWVAGRFHRPSDRAVIDALAGVAAARGVPPAQIAIAWLLSKRVVSAPIIGPRKLSHLDDPLAALGLKLSTEEIAALEAPYVAQDPIGPQPVDDARHAAY